MVLIGNTVRLKAEFKTFDEILVSPNNVKLKIYSNNKDNLLLEMDIEPVDTGKYQYDYIVPDGPGSIYFEFSGVLNGKPILGRAKLNREWI